MLVVGGASSGKTSFSENLAVSSGRAPVYLATAEARDREMKEKIERHQSKRSSKWRTIEASSRAGDAIGKCRGDEIVVFDCVTMWLMNELGRCGNLAESKLKLLSAFERAACPVIAVTNEIGSGIVPMESSTRLFCNEHGLLNQEIAVRSDTVLAITAGIPVVIKGVFPPWP